MSRVLIPDAGPLLSLASGDLLQILKNFALTVTDVVKEETFDKGLAAQCSVEAQRLLAFYNEHTAHIHIVPTQVGHLLRQQYKNDPGYAPPRNMGELSIQSYLIDLQVLGAKPPPIVLFEDKWFLRNADSLAKPCVLMSTQALLDLAQEMGLIRSADAAREAISSGRPNAKAIFHHQTLAQGR